MNSAKRNGIFMLLTVVAAAYASNKNQPQESVSMLWIFLAFVGGIILFQLLPGIKMFWSLLKVSFGSSEPDSEYLTKGKE